MVDRPGGRKIHSTVVPYLGGLAIYLAFWLTLALSMVHHLGQLTAMVAAGTLVMLIGLFDDRFGLQPRAKLTGQACAAAIVIFTGIRFRLSNPALFDGLLSLVWIVGLTNAMNLLDNMDGLSGGATLISSFFLFLLAAHNGQYLVAAMSLSLMGACMGFLRYNFAPASIFMGDAGSLFLGFIISVIALKLRPTTEAHILNLLVPITLLGLPILDTTLVTLQRIANGRAWYLGGRDHCSHRLVVAGCTRTQAVLILYLVSVIYGLFAILLNMLGPHPLLLAMIAVCTAFLFVRLSTIPVYPKEEVEGNPLKDALGGFPTSPGR
jgi:UDP-GlcNAc:undecaprenyl-phosphate GlcNAc-1-phosphate transferase